MPNLWQVHPGSFPANWPSNAKAPPLALLVCKQQSNPSIKDWCFQALGASGNPNSTGYLPANIKKEYGIDHPNVPAPYDSTAPLPGNHTAIIDFTFDHNGGGSAYCSIDGQTLMNESNIKLGVDVEIPLTSAPNSPKFPVAGTVTSGAYTQITGLIPVGSEPHVKIHWAYLYEDN